MTSSAETQNPQTLELLTVSRGDYPELSAFLSSFQSQTEDPQFWTSKFYWWWDNNPAFSIATKRGWVLRDRGRIVGFLGNIPSCFQLLGNEVTAFASTTWRVLPDYRSSSLGLLLRQINSAKESILFNTTPSPKTYKILEAFRFQLIPRETNRRVAIVINFGKTLGSQLLRNIEVDSLGRHLVSVSRIIGRAHGRGLEIKMLKVLQSRRLKNLGSKVLRVEQLTKADSSFDRLWERTKKKYLNTNVRTAATINWLCFGDKDNGKSLFACYKNNHVGGYMVCRIYQDQKLKVLECLDLWGDAEDEIVVKSLIRATREWAVKNSCDLAVYPQMTFKIRDCLRKLGLWEFKAPERHEYLRINGKFGAKIRKNASYFAFCQGDRGSF